MNVTDTQDKPPLGAEDVLQLLRLDRKRYIEGLGGFMRLVDPAARMIGGEDAPISAEVFRELAERLEWGGTFCAAFRWRLKEV